jgi:hypothetical protein
MSVTDSPLHARSHGGWLRWSALFVLGMVAFTGVTLVWRRMAGALDKPLPTSTLFVCGAFLCGVVLAARWAWWSNVDRSKHRVIDSLVAWGPSVFLSAGAAALSVPGTSLFALLLLWLLVIAGEIAAWFRRNAEQFRRTGAELRETESREDPRSAVAVLPDVDGGEDLPAEPFSDEAPAMSEPSAPTDDPAPDDLVSQRFVRYQGADAEDVFSGWLRVPMAAGSRAAAAHIAFCPAFARAPVVEVEQEDGPPSRIQAAQVLPYGARLDIKLNHTTEEEASVLLRFTATLSDG